MPDPPEDAEAAKGKEGSEKGRREVRGVGLL